MLLLCASLPPPPPSPKAPSFYLKLPSLSSSHFLGSHPLVTGTSNLLNPNESRPIRCQHPISLMMARQGEPPHCTAVSLNRDPTTDRTVLSSDDQSDGRGRPLTVLSRSRAPRGSAKLGLI
eukprot:754424-Hanusia_phi.AAC.2